MKQLCIFKILNTKNTSTNAWSIASDLCWVRTSSLPSLRRWAHSRTLSLPMLTSFWRENQHHVQPLSRNKSVTPDPYFPVAYFRHWILKRFIAICTSLPGQLLRQKTIGISTPTSQQVQIEIFWEKREDLLTAGYVVFLKIVPVSHTKLVQFVQNQTVVKTQLVFPTTDRDAEILSRGFNDRFSGCWMYLLFLNSDCRVIEVF